MQLSIFHIIFTFYIAYIIFCWTVAISSGVSYYGRWYILEPLRMLRLASLRDPHAMDEVVGKPLHGNPQPPPPLCPTVSIE
jgi:hypothetical protein